MGLTSTSEFPLISEIGLVKSHTTLIEKNPLQAIIPESNGLPDLKALIWRESISPVFPAN
jgi:hypothetical protein